MTAMRTALLVAAGLMLLPPTLASAQEQKVVMEDVRDQGVLYFKKKRFPQAKAQLDKAYKTAQGKKDFKTLYYRAQVSYKLLLLEDAFGMAKAAEAAAANDREKRVVQELVAEMSGLYGGVTFKAAKGETNKKGRVFFEAKTGIINREKRQRFESIRERFRTHDIELPTTVYLPFGEYTANKVPFAIVQGEETPELEIFLQVVVGEGDGDGLLWVYIGGGAVAAAALGVGAFFLFREPEPEEVRVQDYVFEPSVENAQ